MEPTNNPATGCEQGPSEQAGGRATTDGSASDWDKAADRFARGALIRGEAARAVDGRLPAGATHEIVEEGDDGVPKLRRHRFKIA